MQTAKVVVVAGVASSGTTGDWGEGRGEGQVEKARERTPCEHTLQTPVPNILCE
jgi:hypothetical protein